MYIEANNTTSRRVEDNSGKRMFLKFINILLARVTDQGSPNPKNLAIEADTTIDHLVRIHQLFLFKFYIVIAIICTKYLNI